MPKEDFTEREIRKIRELLAYLLNVRAEGRIFDIRDRLDDIAYENEFPDFSGLVKMKVEGFGGQIRKSKINQAVCLLYFQLMEIEASVTADEWDREGLYIKALELGKYSEEMDRTFSPERNELIAKIKQELRAFGWD